MADADAVSKEISSKLRGYEGLTAAKLAECPATLETLGTADPQQAHERFVQAVEALPDDRYTGALKYALRFDPLLPDSLTGRSGRRMLFGMIHSVSEETVKSWEARAIDALAKVLTTPPEERLHRVMAAFGVHPWGNQGRVSHRNVVYTWESSARKGMRFEQIETVNKSNFTTPLAAYQTGINEQPDWLTVAVFFNQDHVPEEIYGFGDIDVFDLATTNYEQLIVDGPKPGRELLKSMQQDDAFIDNLVIYERKWPKPTPLRIYGIGWTYGPQRPK